MSLFLLSQILAGLAFVTDFASFQFKKREVTLRLFGISAALLSAHFFLLDQPTAGIVVAISSVRFFTSTFTVRGEFMYLFLALVLLGGIFTFDGYEDTLSLTASLIGTVVAFRAGEKMLRRAMVFTTTLFIIHNIWIWTPVGIVIEVFFLGSNLLSQWRFYPNEKN